MSLFKKFKGKSKGDNAKVGEVEDKRAKPEAEETETVLRQTDKAAPITKEKDRAEHTALEIAEKQDWEVKTLPVWQSGDVILDTYEVEDVISGGMGHVYIANHKNWNVKLAIKSPNEMMLKNKSNFARILREASSWTELGLHPNIAYCYYVRNIEDVPHIFVEYVDGGNLRQWIEEGKCIDYRTNLDLAIQFCHGMEYAHSKGMIHRDIKPENVLMTKDGIVKITDFGLVRESGTGHIQSSVEQGVPNQQVGHGLTTVGTLMGTVGYMAPEQAESASDVDERADIFAFGICLYEMFCGNRPYDITFGPKQKPPDPASLSGDTNFPSDIGAVLTKSVQWDPSKRFKRFKEIRQELVRIYYDLFGEQSTYAELELLDLAADGLNNRGVSYFDLGRKEDAIACWKKAIENSQMHLEATYNLNLIHWRDANIDDLEVVRNLDNCANNPGADKEKLAKLESFIHAERFDFDAAKNVLKEKTGRYETLFLVKPVDQIESILTLKGHASGILSVTFSSDGQYAITGSWDKTIRVWELISGRCVHILEGHTYVVISVALTPDGRYVLSGSKDRTLRVWEFASGQCIHTLKGHTGEVHSVALSPNGRHAVSGSLDKIVRVWELSNGRCSHTLEGHTFSVYSVAITPDGRYAVSGSGDKTVRVWELASGRCIHTLEGHTDSVKSVDVSPNGRYAVSGSFDNTVRVWELASGRCVHTLKGHTDRVTSVAVNSDSRYAVSGSGDKTVRVWELASGRCVCTRGGHSSWIHSVAISIEGRYAVASGHDNTVRVGKLISDIYYMADIQVSELKGFKERKKEENTFDQAISQVRTLYEKGDYSNSFSVLYEAWKDAGFKDNENIYRLYSSLMKKGRIKGFHFSFQKRLLVGHTDWVTSVAVSPDGRYAVSGSIDNTMRVWELGNGECVRILGGHTDSVQSVAVSHDGFYAVSGSKDETLRVWEIGSGRCVHNLKGHKRWVGSVAFSPDGRYMVSGGADRTLRVWEIDTGQGVRTLKGHTSVVSSVALSPDGFYAVSGSHDMTVRVWHLTSGRCVCTLDDHTSLILSVAFTPNGRHVVSSSKDNTVRVWHLASGQCVHTLEGHTDEVLSVAITPDSNYAMSGSWDKTLRVWEFANGRCVHTLEGHMGEVASVAFTPYGRYAVSCSYDNTLMVWAFIWDLEFPDPVDWDEGVRPYLEIFLTLRNGKWTEEDFQELIKELAEKRGYGWVRPEGIKKKLERMTKDHRN